MNRQNDTLSKFGSDFQSKSIAALLTDANFLDQLIEILHSKYFDSESNKWIIDSVLDYHSQYKRPPSMEIFKVMISKLKEDILKTAVIEQLRNIYTKVGNLDMEYIKDEFRNFCIEQNLKKVILNSVDLLEIGNYDKIKQEVDQALKVGQEVDLGHDYILDMEERHTGEQRITIPTDWDVINDLMDGGLSVGELGVVVAPSGVGKTWILTAIGAAAVKQGKSVVHYSMELSEKYVGDRYDCVFTQTPTTEIPDKKDEILKKIKTLPGKLLIKYFPPKSITTKTIETHIEKMIAMGNKPDLVILDYADLVLPYARSKDSTYAEQGDVYIELRGLGGLLELPVWTASQTNRAGIESEVISADKIADSYAKVMNADFIMSWSRKATDKINNTARAHIMKNRFGPDGITFPCKMDTNKGMIDMYQPSSSQGIVTSREASAGVKEEKQQLQKKYLELLGK
jgi:replicative DNA helicase